MVTKLGLASSGSDAYSLMLTLPDAGEQLFPRLAERALLRSVS